MPELDQSRLPRRAQANDGSNLGAMILRTAVEDYQRTASDLHDSARKLLFPKTDSWRRHFDWVVAIAAPGVNAATMRSRLDKLRPIWDAERSQRMSGQRKWQ